MTPGQALEQGLEPLGLALANDVRGRLLEYTALLAKWNRTYNLTAIRTQHEMVTHHLLDSLAIVPHLPMPARAASLADAGSGAGLPGIPIAIARPDWRVALADSGQKKAAFLRQASIELRLRNVEVYEGRVEDWRPARPFHVVVSRAFAALADFIAACRHLVRRDGVLAAMKGTYPGDELAQVAPQFDCGGVVRLQTPLMNAERHLVLCRARG